MSTTIIIPSPSKYRVAIFDWIKNGNGNAVIEAVAGSGKSTTIIDALDIIPKEKTKGFLAFNKAIVEELKLKISLENTDVKTLHSAGFSALIFTYKSKLDTYKYRKFLNDSLYLLSSQITIDSSNEEQNSFKSRVLNLLDLARVELVSSINEIEGIALKHEIGIEEDEAEVVLKLMKWGINNPRTVDFTDMIYIPVVKKLHIKQYDWVLVDECQDLSSAQRELFQMMINPKGGRFIAVGDACQSINGFAGADNESFAKIRSIENTISLPLSICYRCDSNIVNIAKRLVPQIEARENAGEGIVKTLDKISLSDFKPGDMILSRVTAPLVKMCMHLITNGISSYVKGKELGTSLINLVKRTKTNDIMNMFELLANELYKIQVKISKRNGISLEESKDDYAYIALQDKIECLHNISFGCLNTIELIEKIGNLFKDTDKGICCSTIHKSKGLSSERVFVIALDKFPLKRCMNVDWKAKQETNLQYVCYTRAKHELYFVNCDIKEIK